MKKPRPSELRPNWRQEPKFWTPERVTRLEGYLEQGLSDEVIARRFGVSSDAVNLARKRHRVDSRTRLTLNSRKVAAQLGIPCSKTVVGWIEAGWLKARRGPARGGNRQWLIKEEAVLDFLRDPAHWHRWQPERIPDICFREWAIEVRAGVRFLTVGEVAARYSVIVNMVGQWIHKGWLPAVRHANWLIRESDLAGWVVPCERRRWWRRPPRRLTPEEDARLVELRRSGESWRRIGRALHCRVETVRDRYAWLITTSAGEEAAG